MSSIGRSAFYGCYNLKSLELPISLESIGNYVFSWLNKIESIVLKQNKPISLESSSAFPSDMKFIVTPASTITAYKSDAMQVLMLILVLLFLLRKCYTVEGLTLPACVR